MKICIDLGGTNIRIALVDEGNIVKKVVHRTDVDNPSNTLEQVYDFIGNVQEELEGVVIGCPGPLNEASDMIIEAVNLPGWVNYPFKKEIEDKLKLKVTVINDANAATLGEAKRFNEYKNLLYLTISTGFGGGLSQNNKIYTGETNTAFEIKDLIVPYPTNLKRGNISGLEGFCSGTGIYKLALENGLDVKSTKDVFDKAQEGNETAKEILEYTKNTVVDVLINMCYIINPGAIVLGGSVILHNDEYFASIEKTFVDKGDNLTANTKLLMADKNGESGLLGLTDI